MRTQVGIIGAGPAGLVLARILTLAGIECVVLEARSRDYVERRVRAGVLEHDTAALLTELGVGDRMKVEGLQHHVLNLRFNGHTNPIDLRALTGRGVTVYGQQEVVKDLIAARIAVGDPLLFDAPAIRLDGLDSATPVIHYQHDGAPRELRCDIIAGCDGSYGVSRAAIPRSLLSVYEHQFPVAWLGILAQSPPAPEGLVYAYHPHGFALHSLRTPQITRQYLQVAPDTDLADWPDERVWAELRLRLAAHDVPPLIDGPVLEKSLSPMRSLVAEPLRHGRLVLAGDAAHILPATGAKGLNLAIADVHLLGEALIAQLRQGESGPLDAYSQRALRRIWQVQQFTWSVTTMLHRMPDATPLQDRLQVAHLEYLARSPAAAAAFAENYVGLPLDGDLG